MDSQHSQGGKKESITPLPMQDRMAKRWRIAKRKYSHTQLQKDNETVEGYFILILEQAKKLLRKQHQTAFARNLRTCNASDAFVMEAFICPSFYFYLECSMDFVYRVQYEFNNCKYEAEIRGLLNVYALKSRSKEVALQPSFDQFYANVLRVQDDKYRITL